MTIAAIMPTTVVLLLLLLLLLPTLLPKRGASGLRAGVWVSVSEGILGLVAATQSLQ